MKGGSYSYFLGTWFIYIAFLSPGIYSIDGYSMLAVADSLVTHHNVSVPEDWGFTAKAASCIRPGIRCNRF